MFKKFWNYHAFDPVIQLFQTQKYHLGCFFLLLMLSQSFGIKQNKNSFAEEIDTQIF